MVMEQNGIKRRQLINDVFNFINSNKNLFNVNIFNELEIKLMNLWIVNEQSYKICKYWKRDGRCPNRAKCPFQHFTLVKHDQHCHFYQNNKCNRGRDCHYIHNNNDNPFNFNHKFNKRSELPSIPPSIVTINQHWQYSLSNHNHNHTPHCSHQKDISDTANSNIDDITNNQHHCLPTTIIPKKKSISPNNAINLNNNINKTKNNILSSPNSVAPIGDLNSKKTLDSIEIIQEISKENEENITEYNDIMEETSKQTDQPDNTILVIEDDGIKTVTERKENILEDSKEISEESSVLSSVPTTNTVSEKFCGKRTNYTDEITANPPIIPIINNIESGTALETSLEDLEVSSVSTVSTTNTSGTKNTDDTYDTNSMNDTDNIDSLYFSFKDGYDKAMHLIYNGSYSKAWDILNELLSNEKFLFRLRNHPILADSYLMMSYVYQDTGYYREGLHCLEKIKNMLELPQDLQLKIEVAREELYQRLQPMESKPERF